MQTLHSVSTLPDLLEGFKMLQMRVVLYLPVLSCE